MDLDLRRHLNTFGLRPRGVVHVGAHEGQEYELYRACGVVRQLWIEPQPRVFELLVARVGADPGVRCVNVACGPQPGQAVMHLLDGNEGKSSSLLEPSLHLERWPEVTRGGTIEVPVARLDDLVLSNQGSGGKEPPVFDLLCVDVQGFEMGVFRGATEVLKSVDAVVSEVALEPLYAGGCTVREVDAFLARSGLVRAVTKWSAGCAGDAMYVRRSKLGLAARWRLAVFGGPGHRAPRSARRWIHETRAEHRAASGPGGP